MFHIHFNLDKVRLVRFIISTPFQCTALAGNAALIWPGFETTRCLLEIRIHLLKFQGLKNYGPVAFRDRSKWLTIASTFIFIKKVPAQTHCRTFLFLSVIAKPALKWTTETPEQCEKSETNREYVNDVDLLFLSLTLNRFHTLFLFYSNKYMSAW